MNDPYAPLTPANDEPFRRALAQCDALLTNTHAVLTSGKHASSYVRKDLIFPRVHILRHLCEIMAARFAMDRPQVVVGPEKCGMIIASHVADILGGFCDAPLALFAEKIAGRGFALLRGYGALVKGKSVLVTEDVLTSGGSVRKVVEAIRACGGNVIGVAAFYNRGDVTAQDVGNVPRLSCGMDLNLPSWDPAECPLCAAHVPINTEIGHAAKTQP